MTHHRVCDKRRHRMSLIRHWKLYDAQYWDAIWPTVEWGIRHVRNGLSLEGLRIVAVALRRLERFDAK
jgi:hypothetical protein